MESTPPLRRSRTAPAAGVCQGLAVHYRVDPVLVRIAFPLLALSAGLGVVLYALGWLLIPREDAADAPLFRLAPASRRLSRTQLRIAVVVVTVVSVALGSRVLPFTATPLLVLAAVWYVGWHRRDAPRAPAAVPTALWNCRPARPRRPRPTPSPAPQSRGRRASGSGRPRRLATPWQTARWAPAGSSRRRCRSHPPATLPH